MNASEADLPGPIAALLATFGVQTLASMAMFGVAVIAPVAAPAIGVDATLIGTFTAMAYACGMIAGLLTAALTDRYGAIRICQVSMVFACLGVVALAYATPIAAIVSAVLLGLCYGPVNPVSTQILARVAPAKSRPLFFSIKQTGMPAGTALAGALLPLLVVAYDWQTAIVATGVLAIVVAIAIQPLRAQLDAVRRPERPLRPGSMVSPLKLVWRHPGLRCLALAGFIYAGCQVALTAFYVLFLTSELAMPLTKAGLVFMVLQIGAILGRLFWGAIADRAMPASYVLVGLGLLTAVAILATAELTPDHSIWAISIVSFALGATSHGWNGVFFSELVRLSPSDQTGEAAGGIQFASLAGVALLPPGFGAIVTYSGYPAAFLAICIAMALAAIYLKVALR